MYWVRSTEEACWRSHRQMVRALEAGVWSIDKEGVEVEPGLVVSFSDDRDAQHFLYADRKTEARAEPVYVRPGDLVCFHFKADAEFFTTSGRGVEMTESEVAALIAEAQRAHAAAQASEVEPTEPTDLSEDDEMLKDKIENKSAAAPAETKAPAPKPAPKKSSGKKG